MFPIPAVHNDIGLCSAAMVHTANNKSGTSDHAIRHTQEDNTETQQKIITKNSMDLVENKVEEEIEEKEDEEVHDNKLTEGTEQQKTEENDQQNLSSVRTSSSSPVQEKENMQKEQQKTELEEDTKNVNLIATEGHEPLVKEIMVEKSIKNNQVSLAHSEEHQHCITTDTTQDNNNDSIDSDNCKNDDAVITHATQSSSQQQQLQIQSRESSESPSLPHDSPNWQSEDEEEDENTNRISMNETKAQNQLDKLTLEEMLSTGITKNDKPSKPFVPIDYRSFQVQPKIPEMTYTFRSFETSARFEDFEPIHRVIDIAENGDFRTPSPKNSPRPDENYKTPEKSNSSLETTPVKTPRKKSANSSVDFEKKGSMSPEDRIIRAKMHGNKNTTKDNDTALQVKVVTNKNNDRKSSSPRPVKDTGSIYNRLQMATTTSQAIIQPDATITTSSQPQINSIQPIMIERRVDRDRNNSFRQNRSSYGSNRSSFSRKDSFQSDELIKNSESGTFKMPTENFITKHLNLTIFSCFLVEISVYSSKSSS